MRKNFWKNIPLKRLTKEEWEAICDGCGKCCLIKLQNDTQFNTLSENDIILLETRH